MKSKFTGLRNFFVHFFDLNPVRWCLSSGAVTSSRCPAQQVPAQYQQTDAFKKKKCDLSGKRERQGKSDWWLFCELVGTFRMKLIRVIQTLIFQVWKPEGKQQPLKPFFVPFESSFSPIFLEAFCWNTTQKYWTSVVKFYPSSDQGVEERVCQQASVRLQTALKSFHEPFIWGCLVLKSIIQIKKCTLIYGNNSVDNLLTKMYHYERILW